MKKVLAAAAITIASLGIGNVAQAKAVAVSSSCDWLRPYIQWVGLPSTFISIAARESGCARNGICVSDSDDLSCSRFGLNFRSAGMRSYWRNTCSVQHYSQTRDIYIDLLCTKAAFNKQGYSPWQ